MSYLEKIKSKIYQYFGINLFLEQEYEYICSPKYWKAHTKLKKRHKDMGDEEIQGLLIGMWELKYQLYRPMRWWSFRFKKYWGIYRIARFLENLHVGFVQLQWDIRSLWH
jgi:hypothetical protein